jgi:hypothetical protein
MNEQQALSLMIAPGTRRPGKYREGVIQIWTTRACDKSCFGCTQGSNLAGKPGLISVEQFRQACKSLKGYFGVVGMFGGNPATHPQFEDLCAVMREEVPFGQRGLWSNNPMSFRNAVIMRNTFNPRVSNLNVHLDEVAYSLFKEGWPESIVVGLHEDSRHSPPYVAMKDVLKKPCPNCDGTGKVDYGEEGSFPCATCNSTGQIYDEEKAWELISGCDINKHWSAMIGVFRGELQAWFCEIAGAQAMLHQGEEDYPDTGISLMFERVAGPDYPWWKLGMVDFAEQVRKHCHECGIPLRGHGELAQADKINTEYGGTLSAGMVEPSDAKEQVSATHQAVYKPKRKGRRVELVTVEEQLGPPLQRVTDYLGNARRNP